MSEATKHLEGDFAVSRAYGVVETSINEDERTVELSFSSDGPVPAELDGEAVLEVLGHNEGEIDLSRLNDTGPVLWMHEMEEHLGAVVRAWVQDGKGRAIIKFSQDELGKRKMQDVRDGILKSTSVGARVFRYERVGMQGDLPIMRATRWQPYEISLVPSGADPSVGVGRSLKTEPVRKPSITVTMSDEIKTAETAAEKRAIERVNSVLSAENVLRERGFEVSTEVRTRALNEGWDGGKLTFEVISANKSKAGADTAALDEMRKTEKRDFSITRAIGELLNTGRVSGFEGEAMKEISRKTGQALKSNAILVPHDLLRQRSMLAGNFSAGGSFVGVQMGQMIEKLDPTTVCERAGATVLRGVTGPIVFPRVTSGASASWVAEGAAVSKSTPGTDDVTLNPHGIAAYVELSRQLILGASMDAESFARSEILKRIGLGIDRAALVGAGTTGIPRGAFELNTSTSGINTVAFGGAPTWAKIVEFEGAIEADDALAGNLAWITTAPVKAAWKAARRDAGSGLFLAEGATANGYPIYVTSQLASSSYNNRVLFGNFADMLIALYGAVEILVDQSAALQTRGLVGLTGLTHADVAFRHPESFAVSTDAGNQ